MAIRKNEAEEVSSLIIGYKFGLGVVELLLGFAILIYGRGAYQMYIALQSSEFFDDPHDILARIAESLIPYIVQHRLSIVAILFLIGAVKVISCIAIWMGKNWGVHLLLFLMLVLLPFDLFDLFRNLYHFNSGLGNLILNLINIWIILSLTHNHPIRYLQELDWRHLFSD